MSSASAGQSRSEERARAACWIADSHSLLPLVSSFRENARFPVSIYDASFRFIFSAVIPIGFVAFYPVQWILSGRAF